MRPPALPPLPGRLAAGAAQPSAPAAPSELRRYGRGEYPPAEEVRALVAQDYTDVQIAAHYLRQPQWVRELRKRYGIAAAHEGRPVTGRITLPPLPVPVTDRSPKTLEQIHAEHYATFFAEHGPYPKFTDSQIRAYEETWAKGHPRSRINNVTAAFMGDPKPGRAA